MHSVPSFFRSLYLLAALAAVVTACAEVQAAGGGTATNITGLYNTGLTAGGGALSTTTDGNWQITYASTTATYSNRNGYSPVENTAYEGSGYVINASSVSGSSYTPNTSNAQWITAPGATTSSGSGSANTGGDYLPGNGGDQSSGNITVSSVNEGVYVYTLAFTISGTGGNGSTVNSSNSKILISMGIAADDQYAVYVNPSGNGQSIPTGTAAATGYSAWNSTSIVDLANYSGTDASGNSFSSNATFKIGTNYIVIVVYNTNGISGNSSSTNTNASGLLVYQSSAAMINGQPVPEVWPWLPLVGALGCYGLVVWRRRRRV